ncbi:CoA pyrophosphatase [Bacillus sp. JCM 19041]|uniref:NUDIX hydrolase n=1 Tax=Bacillus sp. JCM 19041 TaxID=1460637 RepID=UPI0006D2AADF
MLHVSEIKGKLMKQKTNKLNNKDAAVLLPLVLIEQELHVLFQVRALTLNAQPGETCFPGGRIDSGDDSPEAAAVREFTEEFGIAGSLVSVLAPLPTIEAPRRGLIHHMLRIYVHLTIFSLIRMKLTIGLPFLFLIY